MRTSQTVIEYSEREHDLRAKIRRRQDIALGLITGVFVLGLVYVMCLVAQ